jgi:hypothetical protein
MYTPSTAPTIAQILDELSMLLLTLDADEESYNIRYTEADAMNATLIFMHVLGNIAIHRMLDQQIPMEEACKKHEEHGKRIRQIVKEITDCDPHEFYKSPLPIKHE